MTTSIQYLEAAKIEEVASQVRGEGYDVTTSPTGTDEGYDIVARKPKKRLAVEVKANSQLRDSAALIKSLRRRALEHGYDEFRLVVVRPPREVKVQIEGLDEHLSHHMRDNLPDDLAQLSDSPYIERVTEIEIDSIDVTAEGTRVVGNGVAEISLHYGRWGEHTAAPETTNLPFGFDVKLDRDLRISAVSRIEVDTSSVEE